jgi:hypothetical protein
MGLSDDQRAMLRLLAQRGEEGYDDVAALMGLTVEEVRAKVADALAELAREGALAPSQEKPAVPSAAPTTPPAPAPEPAAEPEPEPEVAAKPEPEPPAQPSAAVKPPAAPAGPVKRPRPAPPKISLPSGNGPRAAIAAAILVVVAVVVVLIVSGGGNSGTDSSTTSASSTTSGETTSGNQATPTSNSAEVTKAVLKPVGAGSASGVAIFGRVKNSLALQVIAKGLAPTTKGSTEYTVWLAQSPQRMLPLASTPVKADGRIGAQFEVPTEVLAYLANGTFDQLVITRTANSALEASLAKATKEERAPTYTGTEVLRGTVVGPIVGAAKRLEEEKAEKGE